MRRPVLLAMAAVFLATIAVFWSSTSCGFVDFDDQKLITENPDFRGLSAAHLSWMLRATVMGHWQPLTWLSYAIDFSIAGIDAAQFHRTNVLLHGLNAALLVLVIRRLIRPAGDDRAGVLASAAGALLWSLHPLRVESVTWVTERRDVLSTLFLLLTVLAYLRAFPQGSVRPASIGAYVASVLLLALSLSAKAWGMSFFVVAAIVDWFPLRRLPGAPWRWLMREPLLVLAQKAPYVALGLASVGMAGYAQKSIGAARTLSDWPLGSRIVQCFYGLVFYPWKTLWPTRLCALYEIRHGLNPLEPQYVACYILVAVTAGVALLLWRRSPWMLAALAAYAISVAPVLGLFQSGDQFVADRYSYIACMSWSVLAAAGLSRASRFVRAPLLWTVPSVLAAALSLLTVAQIPTWTNAVTLWRQAYQSDPTRLVPHINYGLALEAVARDLERAGRAAEASPLYAEAEEHYLTATQVRPKDGRGWYPLANALKRRGDATGAEKAYREAAAYLPQAYLPLVNLAYLLEQDPARKDEALAAFRAAAESVEHPRPGSFASAKPYLALGLALKQRGDLAGARTAFSRGLELATQYRDPETAQQARGQLAALPR